jgi:hypothetical protein
MQASFARPSIGGAVSESLSASPISPVMALLLARAWTRTLKDTKFEEWRKQITISV